MRRDTGADRLAKFKEFRRGYQPWEHEGGGGSIMGGGGGGGDLHTSALDHDFVSTSTSSSGPADVWEGLADLLDETGWGSDSADRLAAAVGAWLKQEGVKSVLEVGSSLGRGTQRLVKDGFKVTAVESSPALYARTKANASGAKVIEGDLVELPEGTFDAVVQLRHGFSRFVLEGQADQFLAHAKESLGPKGLLSIAFYSRDGVDEGRLNRSFMSGPVQFKGKRTTIYDQWQGHPDGGDRFTWAPLFMVGNFSEDWIRRAVPFKFWRIDDVKAKVKGAGFEILGVLDASDGKTAASSTTRRVEIRARAK
jgi:SAM-dependent methyltransferase